MSIKPEILDAMVASGCTAEQIAAVVKAASAKVSTNAERQRRYRERLNMPAKEWSALAAYIRTRDGHTCRYCGSTAGRLHVDHIVPLVQGGSSHPNNLVTACAPCNFGKSGKTVEQWKGAQ